MIARLLDCLAQDTGEAVREIIPVRPAALAALLESLPAPAADFARAAGFTAESGRHLLLPGERLCCLFGLSEDRTHFAFGDLPRLLPAGDWRLRPGDYENDAALLGFCLGAYRYRIDLPALPRLVPPPGTEHAAHMARTIWMVRDLINMPANLLGPAELADTAASVGDAFGAATQRIEGAALADGFPAIAAVGAGSSRPPVVIDLAWRGSTAGPHAPLVCLCGKGVVFDTGGLDLKPSAAMLRMKKDMGGAAILLGVARELMTRDLPIRLRLLLGCVENAVGGAAMRPGDVLNTRAGIKVEVGNTDAEGRLVLADLLHAAGESAPALLIDCATLTGAARVATGPDLPALFCNDDALAESLLAAGTRSADPLWRLPLWAGYDGWLESSVADINNISSRPFAGAIVAALFLQRFIRPGMCWAHIDAYAWNDTARPARPEGGEAQALRALVTSIVERFSGNPTAGR